MKQNVVHNVVDWIRHPEIVAARVRREICFHWCLSVNRRGSGTPAPWSITGRGVYPLVLSKVLPGGGGVPGPLQGPTSPPARTGDTPCPQQG